jgi:hypothetical protein
MQGGIKIASHKKSEL